MEKIFAIGDIHGCLDELDALLSTITINADRDLLLFIGDYIDRGPASKGVVDRVLELKARLNHVVCLMGNHEQMFLDYITGGTTGDMFLYNGGDATLRSYRDRLSLRSAVDIMPEAHRDFFESLQLFFETDDYLFVHAGFRPGIPLEEQDREDLFWIRYEFIRSDHDFGKTVVFGHTPFPDVYRDDYKIGIDTGAVYGGYLTCLELPAEVIHQVGGLDI
ncbi:MAG: serine/threonine protein phosphatase [Deltaproteobacteria bacterium]|nr:serine/threonine protein phosphatase [Deltaproteobacteria bacterium]